MRFEFSFVLLKLFYLLLAAEASYFSYSAKVTKTQVTSLCFFAAQGLYSAKADVGRRRKEISLTTTETTNSHNQ
jgi:hypothetical protein